MPDDDGVRGISRRKMLKRLGAGAAVAWSAPILTSIRTPAFAQYVGRCDPTDVFCGSTDPACDEASGCQACSPGNCASLDDGSCFCWGVAVCVSPTPACQIDSDCDEFGPGGKCAPTVCGDPPCAGNRICLYPCGAQPRTLPRGEGIHVVTAK